MTKSKNDVFREARRSADLQIINVEGEAIPMFLSYHGVRGAAKDWETFSSNAPFRVPIPSEEKERGFRQLPIETDPPEHARYRDLLEPIFRRPASTEYVGRIKALASSLIERCTRMETTEVVRELALPFQSYALACLLGAPDCEADEWISWGTHVFRDGGDSVSKGAALEEYLCGVFIRADDWENEDNLFSSLNRADFEGRKLTENEKLGIANLVFAGGRDTVINTISFIVGYFAERRSALKKIANSERSTSLAVEEFVRFVSPLAHIGRVCARPARVGNLIARAGERVSLCWASANFDEAVFEDGSELLLDRIPNPHVGFGSGHHQCLGAQQARVILRSLIKALAQYTNEMCIVEAVPNLESIGHFQRPVGYDKLVVQIR